MRALAFGLLVCLAGAARAEVVTSIDADVDLQRRQVVGRVEIRAINPGDQPLARAYLWLYPNRFGERPRALDDVNFSWVYPERFDPGWMTVSDVVAGGAATRVTAVPHGLAGPTLVEVSLPRPVPPGGELVLTARFHTRVPERLGAFGCVRGGCVLAGGWSPLLAGLDRAGWDLQAPPARGRIRGELRTHPGEDALWGGGAGDGRVAFDENDVRWLPVAVAPRLYAQRRVHRGVELVYLGRRRPPPSDDAAQQILPYTEEDTGRMVLDVAARALDAPGELATPPAGMRIVFVSAPLRLEVAVPQQGGVIFLSDRVFGIFPLKRFRKFHEREIARSVYLAWLERTGRGLADGDRDLRAEVGAAFLTDVFTVAAYRKTEFAGEVLAPVSFVPAVDELLTDRLVTFADAYFGGPVDSDAFRDDLRRFASPRPRGNVLHEKLRDALGGKRHTEAMRRLVAGPVSVRDAAGAEQAEVVARWRRGATPYNLRLGKVVGRRVEILRDLREGEAPPPIEPIEVRVTDAAGKRHELVWDGRGQHGSVEAVGARLPLGTVVIDPRGRIAQEAVDDRDPRGDDRRPPRYKLLYNGFGINVSISDLTLGLLLDFTLKRQNDPRSAFRLQIVADEAVLPAASLGYVRSLGSSVTRGRLAQGFGVTLGGSRLRSGFAGADTGASRASLALRWFLDTRRSILNPRDAWSAGVGVRGTMTAFDDEDSPRFTGSVFAEATRFFTPADGHTLVGNLEGALVGGDIFARSQLLGAGGLGGLRGFGTGELFGRGRVLGHLEWRGLIASDLDWNLGHFAWVRSASAAAFIDAGVLGGCDTVFRGGGLWGSAGVGLRFFYENFGVQPAVLAIDLAVPLGLRRAECLGDQTVQLTGRPPVALYVSFVPTL